MFKTIVIPVARLNYVQRGSVSGCIPLASSIMRRCYAINNRYEEKRPFTRSGEKSTRPHIPQEKIKIGEKPDFKVSFNRPSYGKADGAAESSGKYNFEDFSDSLNRDKSGEERLSVRDFEGEAKEEETNLVARPVIIFDEKLHNTTTFDDFYDSQISPPELFWRPGEARIEECYKLYMADPEKYSVLVLSRRFGFEVDYLRKLLLLQHYHMNPARVKNRWKFNEKLEELQRLKREFDNRTMKTCFKVRSMNDPKAFKELDNPFYVDNICLKPHEQMPQPIFVRNDGRVPAFRVLDDSQMSKYNKHITKTREIEPKVTLDTDLYNATRIHKDIYGFDDMKSRHENPTRFVFVDQSKGTNKQSTRMAVYVKGTKKRRSPVNNSEVAVKNRYYNNSQNVRKSMLW